jgi:hypothetical protein
MKVYWEKLEEEEIRVKKHGTAETILLNLGRNAAAQTRIVSQWQFAAVNTVAGHEPA